MGLCCRRQACTDQEFLNLEPSRSLLSSSSKPFLLIAVNEGKGRWPHQPSTRIGLLSTDLCRSCSPIFCRPRRTSPRTMTGRGGTQGGGRRRGLGDGHEDSAGARHQGSCLQGTRK